MLLEEILKRQTQKFRTLVFLQISSLGFFKSSRLARKRSHIDLVGISLDLRNDGLPREIVERNQVDFIFTPPPTSGPSASTSDSLRKDRDTSLPACGRCID